MLSSVCLFAVLGTGATVSMSVLRVRVAPAPRVAPNRPRAGQACEASGGRSVKYGEEAGALAEGVVTGRRTIVACHRGGGVFCNGKRNVLYTVTKGRGAV